MLVATLYPHSDHTPSEPVIKSIPVGIKRYTSSSSSDLSIDPVLIQLDSPVRINVQIPRAVYRVGEPLPVYITIPPPDSSIRESGLRLRNVKAELVRDVRLGDVTAEDGHAASSSGEGTSGSYPPEKTSASSSEITHSTVLTRSGAACRFHSSRPVQLRLVLHDSDSSPPSAGITQATLLHHVSFHLHVQISFTSPISHTATSASVEIPLVMIPHIAPQPLGDISEEIDVAYHKKHDPPPTRTSRAEETLGKGSSGPPAFDDTSSVGILPPPPSFSEASGSNIVAPPLEDAPLFTDEPSGSHLPPSFEDTPTSGSELPTFHESESAAQAARVRVPFEYWVSDRNTDQQELRFAGEGETFGFLPSDQYDGIAHTLSLRDTTPGGLTPPPPMPGSPDEAEHVNLTRLAQLINGGNIAGGEDDGALDGGEDQNANELSPPPPPAMDDPSDPPPAIDEGVHALSEVEQERRERAIEAAVRGGPDLPNAPPPLVVSTTQEVHAQTTPSSVSSGQPPPYLGVPESLPQMPVSTQGPPPYAG